MSNSKVEKFIDRISNLPVLPEVANRVIQIAESPDPDINEMANLIQMDPSITAKILKLLNSGYFSLRNEVTSVKQAVLMLGIKEVRNLVVTMITVNHFEEPGHAKIQLSDFWNHSLGVATIATSLADRFGYKEKGDLYLAGLLHDVGKLVLQAYFPILMGKVIREIDAAHCQMWDAEQKILGFSHAELGSLLARKWNFPPAIQDAIAFHHDCKNGQNPLFCAILQFADLITKARLFAVYGDQHFDVVFEDQPCWDVLQQNCLSEDLDFARLLMELDDDIEKARALVLQARGK